MGKPKVGESSFKYHFAFTAKFPDSTVQGARGAVATWAEAVFEIEDKVRSALAAGAVLVQSSVEVKS